MYIYSLFLTVKRLSITRDKKAIVSDNR